ncbi:MAG: hypothetical protein R2684_04545 [Pyrinomonadaceae bacterium]
MLHKLNSFFAVVLLLNGCSFQTRNAEETKITGSVFENGNQIEKEKTSGPNGIHVPIKVNECIDELESSFNLVPASEYNPYYLTGNLDGEAGTDLAVLVKKAHTTVHGLVVCRDGAKSEMFGELAFNGKPLTSFERDNYVTDDWGVEAIDNLETHKATSIQSKSKLERIGFSFDGGSVCVEWNGDRFVVEDC